MKGKDSIFDYTFEVGRHESTETAQAFSDGLTVSNVISSNGPIKDFPNYLNFVFTGTYHLTWWGPLTRSVSLRVGEDGSKVWYVGWS